MDHRWCSICRFFMYRDSQEQGSSRASYFFCYRLQLRLSWSNLELREWRTIVSEKFPELSEELSQFIEAQKMFFVATAAADGRINLSPKGQDSLRVLGPNEILWMNLTGSGNETAAHLSEANRMTMMWCAFEGPPQILRVYGTAEIFHPRDARWAEFSAQLPSTVGTRQYFLVSIDLVQTSCGYAVPQMDYVEDRQVLSKWAENRGEEGIAEYWQKRNQLSLDGKPTGILDS